jgi:hypothetical protein
MISKDKSVSTLAVELYSDAKLTFVVRGGPPVLGQRCKEQATVATTPQLTILLDTH